MSRRLYDRDIVLDLWAEHKTSSEIFALTGVPLSAVIRIAGRARKAGDKRAIIHRTLIPQSDFWSDVRIAQLKCYWAEGLSGAKIGALIGTTRSAVIGKANRLGLAARRPRSAQVAKPCPKRRPRQLAVRRRLGEHGKPFAPARAKWTTRLEIIKRDEPASLGIALVDLQRSQCKWPHGEGPYLFCGHKAFPGDVYCPFHASLATRPRDHEVPALLRYSLTRAAV